MESDLKFNMFEDLARVGDSRELKGGASIAVQEGYDLAFIPGDEVAWSIRVKRITGGIELSGTISGKVVLKCYRCLEDFSHSFDIRLREHALWLSANEIEPRDDYAETYMVVDGELDLLPVLRDAICFSLPSTRVCKESCRGLCPVCGVNLNFAECGCETETVDPRLRPLAQLKKRMEESGNR